MVTNITIKKQLTVNGTCKLKNIIGKLSSLFWAFAVSQSFWLKESKFTFYLKSQCQVGVRERLFHAKLIKPLVSTSSQPQFYFSFLFYYVFISEFILAITISLLSIFKRCPCPNEMTINVSQNQLNDFYLKFNILYIVITKLT